MAKSKLPWFPFHATEWLLDIDVQDMSLAEQGLYVRLLCFQWREGAIPLAIGTVCTVGHVTLKDLEDHVDLGVVLSKFPEAPNMPGFGLNPKLEEIRKQQENSNQALVERAKKGGKAKAKHELLLKQELSRAKQLLKHADLDLDREREVLLSERKSEPGNPPPAGAEEVTARDVQQAWCAELKVIPQDSEALTSAARAFRAVMAGWQVGAQVEYMRTAIRCYAEICAESKKQHTNHIPLKVNAFVRHFEVVQQRVNEFVSRPKITRVDIYAEDKDAT